MQTISTWWGLIAVAIAAGAYAALRWEHAKTVAAGLLVRAEKEARARALQSGAAKLHWVAETSYTYLPPVFKLFVSLDLWKRIVQAIWDAAKRWAEAQPEPELPDR